MPTATPYYGKAMGNGFPFCLERVNVADSDGEGTPYDYWSTLGGTTKENVAGLSAAQKAENISLSWQNAWRLYWMLYKINGTADLSSTTTRESTIDFTQASENTHRLVQNLDNYKAEMAVPINRLCDPNLLLGGELDGQADWLYGVPYANTGGIDALHSNFFVEDVAPKRSPFVRMYNGATSNESNFVGYGMQSRWSGWNGFIDLESVGSGIVASWIPVGGDLWVALLSYADIVEFPLGPGGNPIYPPTPIGYGEIPIAVNRVQTGESIPCIVCAFTEGDPSGARLTGSEVDFNTRRAYNTSSTDPTIQEGVRIDSIEFYNQ